MNRHFVLGITINLIIQIISYVAGMVSALFLVKSFYGIEAAAWLAIGTYKVQIVFLMLCMCSYFLLVGGVEGTKLLQLLLFVLLGLIGIASIAGLTYLEPRLREFLQLIGAVQVSEFYFILVLVGFLEIAVVFIAVKLFAPP